VVIEFALSLVLMAAAVSAAQFPGPSECAARIHSQNVMTSAQGCLIPISENRHLLTPAQEAPFFRELLRRSRALPKVEEAALGDTASIPLDESLRDLKLISEGQFLFMSRAHIRSGEPAVAERSALRRIIFTC